MPQQRWQPARSSAPNLLERPSVLSGLVRSVDAGGERCAALKMKVLALSIPFVTKEIMQQFAAEPQECSMICSLSRITSHYTVL